MTSLVEIKQLIKAIYIRYEMWITPLWKFLLSFSVFVAINHHVGYLAALKPLPIVLMCALLCSFMPTNFMVFIAGFFILGHFYAVSIETLAVTLVLFLLMFLLYFRFGPGDTLVLILTPMLFMFGIPYLMPLALGLIAGPVSVAAMSCGVVVYYLLSYVQANATTMGASSVAAGEDPEIIVQLRTFLTGFLTNRAMWIMVVAFAAVLIVVYLIRRLPIDHAWKTAILVGAVLNLVILMVGDFLYDTQLPFIGVVFGTIFSALLCFVLEFFFFQLDYSRTERVQFEDDDYYYYVKAVPKVTLAEPERRVKKINRTHNAPHKGPSRQNAEHDSPDAETAGAEDEVLRERAPRRASATGAARTPASRGTGARPRTARPAGAAGRPGTRPAGPRTSAPAGGGAHAGNPSDGTRDRVLRVGSDQTKQMK